MSLVAPSVSGYAAATSPKRGGNGSTPVSPPLGGSTGRRPGRGATPRGEYQRGTAYLGKPPPSAATPLTPPPRGEETEPPDSGFSPSWGEYRPQAGEGGFPLRGVPAADPGGRNRGYTFR